MRGSKVSSNGRDLRLRRSLLASPAVNLVRTALLLVCRIRSEKSMSIFLVFIKMTLRRKMSLMRCRENMKQTLDTFSILIDVSRLSSPKWMPLKWPEWMGSKLPTLSNSLLRPCFFWHISSTNLFVSNACPRIGLTVK